MVKTESNIEIPQETIDRLQAEQEEERLEKVKKIKEIKAAKSLIKRRRTVRKAVNRHKLKRLLKKYPVETSRTATIKMQIFLASYIGGGLTNPVEAYKLAWHGDENAVVENAAKKARDILSRPKVWIKVNQELEKTGLIDMVSKDFIYHQMILTLNDCNTAASRGDKIRLLENLAKMKGMMGGDKNTVNVAVIDGVKVADELLTKRRLDIHSWRDKQGGNGDGGD